MRKRITSILGLSMLLIMSFSLNSFASSGTGSVTVPTGCIFTTGKRGVTRTGNYSYVDVKANSVYPTGNYSTDNYTKCKTAIYKNDDTSTKISNTYILTEGEGYSEVIIFEGYLSLGTVNICFAGNNPSYGAVVDFSYDGK